MAPAGRHHIERALKRAETRFRRFRTTISVIVPVYLVLTLWQALDLEMPRAVLISLAAVTFMALVIQMDRHLRGEVVKLTDQLWEPSRNQSDADTGADVEG